MAAKESVPPNEQVTLATVYHDVGTLKEIIFTRMDAMDKAVQLFQENLTRVPTDVDKQVSQLGELLATRLDGMQKAADLVQANVDRHPTLAEKQVQHLREVCEEKFSSIETQFLERDTRTEQTSRDSKVAVDAALQAAKEAVGEQNKSSALAIAKSEAATTKQIDQIVTLINVSNGATNDKIEDIKERITSIEGRSKGIGDSIGMIIGIMGVGIALGMGIVAIAMFFKHS